MMAYAAKKTRICQRIRADIAALAEDAEGATATLARGIADLRALDAELVSLTVAFREAWLARACYSEMGITLGHLSRTRERLACAIEWLGDCSREAQAGNAPNLDLTGYARDAASYEILGQSFHRQMREAGVPL